MRSPDLVKSLLTGPEEPQLYSIPLNNSFPVDGPLPPNSYYQVPSPQQWAAQGAFFQDAEETMLYSFGGFSDDKQPPINILNTYNITSSEWSNVSVSGGDFNYHSRGETSRATSKGSDGALGFVSGGWNDLGGMIRFDATDPTNPEWRNETDNTPPLSLEGRMEFIRLGPRGSLIALGGYNKDYINPTLTGWSFDLRPLSQVSVYDIDSATWYNVTTGGDIPSGRSAFCTVVSSAPDDSSFQITMYGGWDLFAARAFAETYVLSLPSFQWINVTGSSNPDASISKGFGISGRNHHACAVYKDRQMLVLGGIIDINGEEQNLRGCNEDLPAIRALDLTTFKWTDRWNGRPEPYAVPDAVTRIIGGNGQGGATMKQPDGGFNDSALNTVFGQVVPRYTPRAASSSGPGSGTDNQNAPNDPGNANNPNNPNNPPSGTSDDSSSGPIAGAIAGGVIGGIAGLALIATLVFLMRARKRRAAVAAYAAAAADPSHTHSPAMGELNGEQQRPPLGMGEYYKSPNGGGYAPVQQEMDTGYRGNELVGHHDGKGRRMVGELPG